MKKIIEIIKKVNWYECTMAYFDTVFRVFIVLVLYQFALLMQVFHQYDKSILFIIMISFLVFALKPIFEILHKKKWKK